MQLPVKSHPGSRTILNLAQTITHLQGISYDFIQTISEWPLFTSEKCTYITLYTSHYILKTVRVAQLN